MLAKLVTGLTNGTLWRYAAATFLEAVLGCLVGTVVAVPLAIAIHRSRWADAATRPYLGGTQAIPAIALAPLLVLWLGYGLGAIVVLCALIVFFPILVFAVSGLAHIDHDIVDAARIDGASSWQRLIHVELPLASPSLMAGLRNGFTLSVTGAVVGEMVMGGSGLGSVLTVQRDRLDTAGMFATIARFWRCWRPRRTEPSIWSSAARPPSPHCGTTRRNDATTARRVARVRCSALTGCTSTAPSRAAPRAPASKATATPTGSPPVIGLAYIPSIQFSPFYVADRSGLFGTARVSCATMAPAKASSPRSRPATRTSSWPVATRCSRPGPRAPTWSRSPRTIVAPRSGSSSPADSPITTPADLRGRTIGVPGKYGETWFGLKLALSTAGLTESDVKIVEIGYTQQAALATKKVDAVMGFVNGDAVAMQLAGFPTRSIEVASDVPLVSICLITTKAYATAHPDTVKAVVAGTVAGMKSVVADQSGAVTASERYIPGPVRARRETERRAVLAATVPLLPQRRRLGHRTPRPGSVADDVRSDGRPRVADQAGPGR